MGKRKRQNRTQVLLRKQRGVSVTYVAVLEDPEAPES
jgi:hypothetical protein